MTLNGTINPDFSQVEADVAQLDVNQRFALFYPEKRPFFLEGIDYFVTPIQSVFTRTVADPYYGAKLTGKQGGNAIGVFVTRDSINNLVFPSNAGSSEASLDDDVSTVVGRYRRDVGSSSTIGALYAGREGEGYHNRQIGADLFWRPTQSDAFRVQYIRTDTQYPEAVADDHGQPKEAFAGNGTWIDYQHITEKWMAFGSYEAYDSGFRADTGFVPQGGRPDARGAGPAALVPGRGSVVQHPRRRRARLAHDRRRLEPDGPDGGAVRELHGSVPDPVQVQRAARPHGVRGRAVTSTTGLPCTSESSHLAGPPCQSAAASEMAWTMPTTGRRPAWFRWRRRWSIARRRGSACS